jgi:hypothetical protein
MSTKTVLDRIDELYDEIIGRDKEPTENQMKGF